MKLAHVGFKKSSNKSQVTACRLTAIMEGHERQRPGRAANCWYAFLEIRLLQTFLYMSWPFSWCVHSAHAA